MSKDIVEDQYAKYWMENGIIFVCFQVKDLDLVAAKESLQKRMDTFEGKHPVIVDINSVKNIPTEVRQYIASAEAQVNLKAAAIISGSLATRMMFDFFVNFSTPNIPMKLFSNQKDALEWIRNFV